MNPLLGWALAALFVFASWHAYGGAGVAFAVSGIVFWLLLQFNRTMRVMRNASHRPVGHVASAVMFNAKLRRGMTMLDVVTLTRSLGKRRDDGSEDDWHWVDPGGSEVRLHFGRTRLESWVLDRSAAAADEPHGDAPPPPAT